MPINLDKPHLWRADVAQSVDFYNEWFMRYAPEAYRGKRAEQAGIVEEVLRRTDYLRHIEPEILISHPSALTLLRAATAPPIAQDRLTGLAGVSGSLVESMEGAGGKAPRVPPRMPREQLVAELIRVGQVIERMADRDLMPWLAAQSEEPPVVREVERAATVLADRICGAATNPIIRNAQETRQLGAISEWLEARGYQHVLGREVPDVLSLRPGTFVFRYNVRVGATRKVNIPVDVAVQRHGAEPGTLPLLIEAKSAGDYANTNKRRKEEAQKAQQIQKEYGSEAQFVLFLCGYFGPDYLGYEAFYGIDWVWEHRPDDFAAFGL